MSVHREALIDLRDLEIKERDRLIEVLRQDGSEAQDFSRRDEKHSIIGFIIRMADDLDNDRRSRGHMWTERARHETRAEASKLRELAVLLTEDRHHSQAP